MPHDTETEENSPSSPFNRTAQHDAKRTAILSQAAKLFNYKGSRATTLRDIAESLGLTKTSLYYYVKTKEELIYQCYMAALDHHHSALDDIEKKHERAVDRASRFYLQHFDDWLAAQEGRAPHTAVLLEIAGLKGHHREEVEARYIAMFKRLRGHIREGVADGSLRSCDPTSAVLAILGSLNWTFSWLHTVPRDQVHATAQEALSLIAKGLYAGTGEYSPLQLDDEESAALPLQGFNREEQNRLKQEAFYKTGTWFFNKKGFNGTSLDEIAEHLNVSKGAFYYHIKNKEDLLVNCYNRSLDITERLHEQAAQTPGSGLQRADLICRRTFHVQNSEIGPLIRYSSITALPMERRLKILQRTEAANARFGEFLREGIADGSVRPVNIFIAQNLIAGAINAAMQINLWRKVDSIDAAATDYFDIFFNGLLPRKSP
ncbi:MAG: TetR/AcrR family transcriptional regulator [Gammaproteobacteria bacterium]|nr:TetR/AcrR family transcriptional regulator [Gammaproteobacteria bacterium]